MVPDNDCTTCAGRHNEEKAGRVGQASRAGISGGPGRPLLLRADLGGRGPERGGLRQHARRPPERGAPDSTGGAAADRLAALAQSRAPVPGGVARVPAGTGDAGAGGEPDALGVRAPPLRLFSIADHVVRTGGASLLRCGARRWRLVSPSGTATRPAATRRAGASGSRGGRGRGSSRPQ